MARHDADLTAQHDDTHEWLEADRLGGFAMGTASGVRTRRYHGLLVTATSPPTGRVVLVAGVEAWIEDGRGAHALSSQRYAPDVVHPDGHTRLVAFTHRPWPTWTYRVDERRAVVHEVLVEPLSGDVVLTWRLVGSGDGGDRGGGDAGRGHDSDSDSGDIHLCVRPLLAARDYHALCRENGAFRFDAAVVAGNVAWQPYPDRPAITALTTGRYVHEPTWYRQFTYTVEQRRGLDHVEDLASPGVIRLRLSPSASPSSAPPAAIVLRAGHAPFGDAAAIAANARDRERIRRAQLEATRGPLVRAAEAYLVRRGDGLTVIAGYPWFTDWGRDTFIALRGLCLSSGRPDDLDAARRVLLAWSDAVSEGMLPNRFTDGGEAPEYNSVDASLWYVVVVGELLARGVAAADRDRLLAAVRAIVSSYARGTRYHIRADSDGLLAAGRPGVQLTWMDAKIGDRVITPRIGKPVEIQALWINALAVAEKIDPAFADLRAEATASFLARFPRPDGSLYDVVDADHVAGNDDPSFRPNQIFAVGGLPVQLLRGPAARALVDAVERVLWTPAGLRSLAPDDPAYRGRYDGGPVGRDEAYHQGTVWQWLAGPFIEGWLRVRGNTARARAEARDRLIAPLIAHLDAVGLGHVSEIADGDPPHTPRGTPFQAWSLAELIRARRLVGDEP